VTTIECDREHEILEAVITGCWPGDLRAHADRCGACGEVAALAAVFRDERARAWSEAGLPTAGQVWWRAAMRRRAEAAAKAARPITLLQGIAGACAAGAAAGAISIAAASLNSPLPWLSSLLQRDGSGLSLPAAATQPAVVSLALLVGAAVLLTPLWLYLALSEE
jgi:hypothetical protein